MTKHEFIFQGFTARTHAGAIRGLLDCPDIKRVWLGVAFVNEGGVKLIENQLKANAHLVTVFAGIRNDITSYQGLKRLFEIGCKLYTVDTGSRRLVFHPKLYLATGKSSALLTVGSANLTRGGLNNNIEAGLLLNLDLTAPGDKLLVDEIEGQLTAIPKEYPDHVTKITKVATLDALLAGERIIDETVIVPTRIARPAAAEDPDDSTPLMKLKVPFLSRPLHKSKVAQPKSDKSKSGKPNEVAPEKNAVVRLDTFELVWESKPLERRDLDIPTASNTHRTYSMNLDKGLLPPEVDHRHYFKDEVFSGLVWKAKGAAGKVVEAFAKFQLDIKGVNFGEFDLRIGHSTSTASTTYLQKNAMTSLSWGPVRQFIAREDLLGRTLELYRSKLDPTQFILEIA